MLARTVLTDYDALLWLLDYWQNHYAEMDLPGDRETRAAAVKRMLLREQIDDPETVTVSRVESLNGEEQRQFAEYCYLAAMSKLDRFRTELELTMLNCIQVTGPESAFPFLQAQREDVRLETDTFCLLGEYWPFHLNLHPGVNEMLTEKANRVYYETVTSTMNPAKEVGGAFYDDLPHHAQGRGADGAVTSGDTDPNTLLPHVREKIDAFVSGGEQFDDITMLALCYRGSNAL